MGERVSPASILLRGAQNQFLLGRERREEQFHVFDDALGRKFARWDKLHALHPPRTGHYSVELAERPRVDLGGVRGYDELQLDHGRELLGWYCRQDSVRDEPLAAGDGELEGQRG